METILLSLLVLLLLFFSAYSSSAEAALFSLQTTQIKSFQSDSNPRKKIIGSLLEHPHDLLVTVFMLNTLVNILLQNVTSTIFGDTASWVYTVGIPLVLTLIFGELIPKYIGLQNNEKLSLLIAPSINFFQKLLKPIRQATIAITIPVSRALFFFLKKESEISKEELEHILRTSEEHGIFNKDEGELISGYLQLQESQAREIARPREDILFYDINEPLTKLTHLFVDEQCTRLPVCDADLDKVLGIITAKNFLVHRSSIETQKDIKSILAKPLYVPEQTPAKLLLNRFNEQEQELALVVDEYGSISGLITREDLLELVVGEIADNRDKDLLYTKSGENEIIASGKMELDEFNEIFDVSLESESGMVTIGGWLMEQMGEIPKSGTKLELNNFLFHVLAATPNRIKRLYARKLKKK
jgi:putative hemolysin